MNCKVIAHAQSVTSNITAKFRNESFETLDILRAIISKKLKGSIWRENIYRGLDSDDVLLKYQAIRAAGILGGRQMKEVLVKMRLTLPSIEMEKALEQAINDITKRLAKQTEREALEDILHP
jgi:hypothetical protein